MNRLAVVLTVLAAVAALNVTAYSQQTASLPARKPGQWEVRMVAEKPAAGLQLSAQMCIDAATDRELMDFGLRMSKETCKRYDMKRQGQSWVIEAECTFGPVSSASRTTITGDFQSSVTVRIEGTTQGLGGDKGPQQMAMTQTGKWIGACTAGMTPGDIALENGLKFNVKQMRQLQKMLPNIQIR